MGSGHTSKRTINADITHIGISIVIGASLATATFLVDLAALAEDVGRHSAVDKVIGIRALKNRGFSKCFLALSGRLTGDMVLKAARIGLPIVASKAVR